jgi:hypothetical protein
MRAQPQSLGPPHSEGFATSKRPTCRWIGWRLAVTVLAALVVLGLTKSNLAQVGQALADIKGGWVALGAGLMVGALIACGQS